MAIRINLLAEAQAAEEMRRRDPVKRTCWVGAFLVALLLAYASLLQLRIVIRKADSSRLSNEIARLEKDYSDIVTTQKSLTDARRKLNALKELSNSRYLTGNLLDSLQHAYVPDVRMVKLRTAFDYTLKDATAAKTNAFKVIPGQPASSTEKITVRIEAVDASSNPGDQVSKYKQAISDLNHVETLFQDTDNDVRLTTLNPPTPDANGKQYVLFTLQCAYPETTR